MKNPFIFFVILIFISACGGSIFFLLRSLKKDRKLIALVGLFCLSMGLFLLILDLILITFVHGAQHIPDYLLFNRLVSDTGFAGRWVLTVYLFICIGYASSIYLLAGNLIKKFNRGKTKNI
ncbi:hypothetical protein ACFLZ5_00980 [Thermodesulfobacteriota bacterium]